jgi:FKBP-type peptidyl-prolyl cis-trans isomerase FklB
MDKFSYSIGLGIGQQLASMGASDINVDDFAQAIRDVLEGRTPVISHTEARDIANKRFQELADQANAQAKQQGTTFLEENKKRANVVTLESGLQYEVMNEGTGRSPKLTDKVKCHYEGTFIDGSVFDSSIRAGKPAEFGVNQVIAGWTEALQLMKEGSKWRLWIPYNLAYGEQGYGNAIPPYSTLVFEVELLKVL